MDSWYDTFYYIAIGSLGIIGSVSALLYFYQNKMIYLPCPMGFPGKLPEDNPPGYQNPLDRNLPYDDVYLTTKDNLKLHAWLVKRPEPDAPTVVIFQANAGNMGLRMDIIQQFVVHLRVNVFIVSYRGYGHSEGTPTEEGLKLDAEAALEYIFTQAPVDKQKVFIHGSSLGGAVAIYAASELSHYNIRGVILENTFTSLPDMVDTVMPLVAYLKKPILRNFWPSESRIRSVKTPILFISGDNDELVPPAHMQRLKEAAVNCSRKEEYIVAGGTHNMTWRLAGTMYVIRMSQFIKSVLEN